MSSWLFFTGFCVVFTLGIIGIQLVEISGMPEINHRVREAEKLKNRRGYSVYRIHLEGLAEPVKVRREVFLHCLPGRLLRKPAGEFFFVIGDQRILFVPPALISLGFLMGTLFGVGFLFFLRPHSHPEMRAWLERQGAACGMAAFAGWFVALFLLLSR